MATNDPKWLEMASITRIYWRQGRADHVGGDDRLGSLISSLVFKSTYTVQQCRCKIFFLYNIVFLFST